MRRGADFSDKNPPPAQASYEGVAPFLGFCFPKLPTGTVWRLEKKHRRRRGIRPRKDKEIGMNRNRMTGFAVAVVLALGMTVIGCDTGGGSGNNGGGGDNGGSVAPTVRVVDPRLIGRWESSTNQLLSGLEFTSTHMIHHHRDGRVPHEMRASTQDDGLYLYLSGRWGRLQSYSITGNILSLGGVRRERVQRFSWE